MDRQRSPGQQHRHQSATGHRPDAGFVGHLKLKGLGLADCSALTEGSIDTFAAMPALNDLALPIQFQNSAAMLHRMFGTRMGSRVDIRSNEHRNGPHVAAFNCRGFIMTLDGPSVHGETAYISGKPVNDSTRLG